MDNADLEQVILDYSVYGFQAPFHAIAQYVKELQNLLNYGDYLMNFGDQYDEDSENFYDTFVESLAEVKKEQRDAIQTIEQAISIRKTGNGDQEQARIVQEGIRNHLNVISGEAHLMREMAEEDTRFRELVGWCKRIEREAQRAAEATNIQESAKRALDRIFELERAVSEPLRTVEHEFRGARVLVIDDNDTSRDQISEIIHSMGCEAVGVDDPEEGLKLLADDRNGFSLVILELILPKLTGLDILHRLQETRDTTPTIVVTSVSDATLMERTLQAGAYDFITKPATAPILRARVRSAMQRQRMNDETERLLTSIIPKEIVPLWRKKQSRIAKRYDHAAILFTDLCGFTRMSDGRNPEQVIVILDRIFSIIDRLIRKHNVQKIKTIGDAYMIASGLPASVDDAAAAARPLVELSLDLMEAIKTDTEKFRKAFFLEEFQCRIGIHVGPAVAGVIGREKFAYDIWGATVNVASRMESHSEPARIHVTEHVRQALGEEYDFEKRDEMDVKSLGRMHTYFVNGRR